MKQPVHLQLGTRYLQVSILAGFVVLLGATIALVHSTTLRALAAPTISSIAPASGFLSGGDSVTISGSGFDADTIVKIGNTTLSPITIVNSTTITGVTPVDIIGLRDVTIINSDTQKAVLLGGFRYTDIPVSITGISPNKGIVAGGTYVMINGSGIAPAVKEISQVSIGDAHTCGIYNEQAYCWGKNNYGQLGNNTVVDSLKPVPVDMSGALQGKTALSVTAGTNHSCMIASDNLAYCWGYNSGFGVLGNNSTTNSSIPVAVATNGVLNGKTIKKITTSAYNNCVIASDDKAYCWGYNSTGQLGDGTLTTSPVPVAVNTATVLANKSLNSIDAGGNAGVCVTSTEGLAYCWGSNSYGQLGNNSTTQSPIPVAVNTSGVLAGKSLSSISTGTLHTCAISTEGLAYCWGNNSGRLGNGAGSQSNVPVAVTNSGALSGKRIQSIDAGTTYTCVVTTDNQVYCWGDNNFGQLGINSVTTSNVPVALYTAGALIGKNIVSISAGINSSCARSSENLLYCWGVNGSGQLGNNLTTQSTVPVVTNKVSHDEPSVFFGAVPALNVQRISDTSLKVAAPAGAPSSRVNVSLTRYDTQTATLSNAYEYIAPPSITGVSPNSGMISGGDTVTITGNDFDANAAVHFADIPTLSSTWVNATTMTAVAPAGYQGIVNVSVTNPDDQVGTAVNAYTYLEPAPSISSISPNVGPANGGQTVTVNGSNFTSGLKSVTAVSGDYVGSGGSTCGIYNTNKVYCWGYNGYGQLGNSSTNASTSPVAVTDTGALAGKTVQSIASGASHRCVVASDSKVYCWGNAYGNGAVASTSAPTAVNTSGVLAGKSISQVVAGDQFSCALSTDGLVFCWGIGTSGQLGNNAKVSTALPVAVDTTGVLSGKSVRQLSAGPGHACAITTDGLGYCWGLNPEGRLGNNLTYANIATPVAVTMDGALNGKTIKSISAGGTSTCAIASDNQAYCWGSNTNGELGNSTFTAAKVPTAVTTTGFLSGKTILSISMGTDFSCAIASDNQVYCWGTNSSSQHGNNVTTRSAVAVPVDTSGVLAGKTIRSVNASYQRTCVVASDSQMYCWGWNSSGPLGDGTSVTRKAPIASAQIKGGNPTITFGATSAPGVTYISPTQLQVATPARAAGAVDVIVRNYDTQSATSPGGYQFVGAPTVSSISPNIGGLAGGTPVTVKGTNFYPGVTASIGGNVLSDIVVVDSQTITGTASSSAAPGAKNVIVSDAYSQSATLTNGFTYRLPNQTITSVTPNAGSYMGGYTVTIKGSNFIDRGSGQVWYRVLFDNATATNVTYVDSSTLTATVPSKGLGKVNVIITSDYSNDATLPSGFTYLAADYKFGNTPLVVAASEPGKLTVQALSNTSTAIISSIPTVIQLSSSSQTGAFATNLSEDESTRWTHTSVTIPAFASSVDVWYKDDTSGTPTITGVAEGTTTFQQQQTITSKYKFLVSGISDPVASGVPSSVTVRVTDYNGVPQNDYVGTFSFTSTDSAAQLPNTYTMTLADRGIKTFTNGVVMKTPGEFCVTATDTINGSTTGSQCNISVRAPNSGSIDRLALITQPQSLPIATTSAPMTVQAQDSLGNPIPVSVNTPLYIYSTSSTASYSADGATWSSAKPYVLTMQAGSTSVNLYVKDSVAGTSTLSFRDLSTDTADNGAAGDLGWKNTSQQLITGVSAAHHVAIQGPDSMLVGQKGTYTLTLKDSTGNTVTALRDSQFTLASSTATARFYIDGDTTGVAGPVTISLPIGSSSLTYQLSDTTPSAGTTMTHVAASDTRTSNDPNYLQGSSTDVQILSALAASVRLTPQQNNVEAGAMLPVTLQLFDTNNDPTYASAAKSFTIASTSGSGKYSLTSTPFAPITSVDLQRGEGTKQLYYRDTLAGGASLTATSNGLSSSFSPITVTSSSTYRLGITPTTRTTPVASASSAYTVTTYDVYGNIVTQPSNLNTYLYSSDPLVSFSSQAAGPWTATSLVIPAGQSSVQFYAKSDAFLNQPATLTVSDVAPLDSPDTGIVNATTQFDVTGQTVASVSYTTSRQTVVAGQASGSITVQLKQADGSAAIQDTGASVQVSVPEGKLTLTADASAASVTTIPVSKGSSSATFYYSGQKSGTYNIPAIFGSAVANQSVIVTADQPTKLAFISSPQTIAVSQASSQIKVGMLDQFNNPASFTSDKTVSLSSSCGDGGFSESTTPWQPTNTISVPSAATSFIFYYKGTIDGTCTLTTSIGGISSASQAITLTPVGPTKLAVHGPASLEKGQEGSFTVSTTDSAGNIRPADASFDVSVSTDSTTGTISRTVVHFNPGDTTQSFTYKDTTAHVATLTAHDATSILTDGSMSTTISNGAPAKLHITPVTSTQYAGDKTLFTVTLYNQYDQPTVASGPVQVALSSSEPVGTFYDAADSSQVVTSITVNDGQQSSKVYYSQLKAGQAFISATAVGLTMSNASVTVLPLTVASIGFVNNAYTGVKALEVGESGEYTVALLDTYGNQTTAPGPVTLYATSSNNNGFVSNSGAFTIPANTATGTFNYTQTQSGNYSLSVSDTVSGNSATLGPITQNGEVVPGVPAGITFMQSNIALERGAVSNKVSVQLVNAHGYKVLAPLGGQNVALSMTSGTGKFSATPNGSFSSSLPVAIPEGESEIGVYYQNDDAQIEERSCTTSANGTRTCTTTRTYVHTIHAQTTLGGSAKGAGLPVAMRYGAPVRLAITSPERQQQTDRATALITVERQNQYGKAVPLYEDSFINVETSSSDTGSIGSSKVAWNATKIKILDSNVSTSFYYKDSQVGQPTLSVSAPGDALIGDSQLVTITQGSGPPPPAVELLVLNISDPQDQGTPSSVIVIAVDANGFIVESYDGTIHFTSDDINALLPQDYTFKPSDDKGSKTFTNEVSFPSSGEKTVTATDGNGLTGSQTDITVIGGNANPIRSIAFTSPASPLNLKPNATSPLITAQLLDGNGLPAVAPAGGFPIRLTSAQASGLFSNASQVNWSLPYTVTIPEGLTFATLYYKDSAEGAYDITVADWTSGVDRPAITNGTLHIVIDDDTPIIPIDPVDPVLPVIPELPGEGTTDAGTTNPGTVPPTSDNGNETIPPKEVKPPTSGGGTSTESGGTQGDTASKPIASHVVAGGFGVGIMVIVLLGEAVRHVVAVHRFRKIVSEHHIASAIIASNSLLKKVTRSAFASAFFWIPVTAAIALIYATIQIFSNAAQGNGPAVGSVVAGVVTVAVLAIGFVVVHSIYLSDESSSLRNFFRRTNP